MAAAGEYDPDCPNRGRDGNPRGQVQRTVCRLAEGAGGVSRLARVSSTTTENALRHESNHVEIALNRASEQLDIQALYEALWRLDLAFMAPSPWLRKIMGKAVEETRPNLEARYQREIAMILLRTVREESDRSSFEHWIAFLRKSPISEDAAAFAAYESGLWARDHLDYDSLNAQLPNIKGDDPAWKLKAASLHCELGESEIAANLLLDALRQVRGTFGTGGQSGTSLG